MKVSVVRLLRLSLLLPFSILEAYVLTNAIGSAGVTVKSALDPTILLANQATFEDNFRVETSANLPEGVYRGGDVKVAAGHTVAFHPGAGFSGAITGSNGTGTRHEFTFSTQSVTWYDCDMEMGMDNSTLGPVDSSGPVVGEPNCIDKVNRAWKSVDHCTQRALLSTTYIRGSVGGQATSVRMNKWAPPIVVSFLQLTAKFNAYISHGSVGGIDATQADVVADLQTKRVVTNKMILTRFR